MIKLIEYGCPGRYNNDSRLINFYFCIAGHILIPGWRDDNALKIYQIHPPTPDQKIKMICYVFFLII
jgi:hypothetical protein